MGYMNERDAEADARSWGARVVRAFQSYHNAKNVLNKHDALNCIKELVAESMNFDYDFMNIDPFGVSGFSKEDLALMEGLKRQIQNSKDGEER